MCLKDFESFSNDSLFWIASADALDTAWDGYFNQAGSRGCFFGLVEHTRFIPVCTSLLQTIPASTPQASCLVLGRCLETLIAAGDQVVQRGVRPPPHSIKHLFLDVAVFALQTHIHDLTTRDSFESAWVVLHLFHLLRTKLHLPTTPHTRVKFTKPPIRPGREFRLFRQKINSIQRPTLAIFHKEVNMWVETAEDLEVLTFYTIRFLLKLEPNAPDIDVFQAMQKWLGSSVKPYRTLTGFLTTFYGVYASDELPGDAVRVYFTPFVVESCVRVLSYAGLSTTRGPVTHLSTPWVHVIGLLQGCRVPASEVQTALKDLLMWFQVLDLHHPAAAFEDHLASARILALAIWHRMKPAEHRVPISHDEVVSSLLTRFVALL